MEIRRNVSREASFFQTGAQMAGVLSLFLILLLVSLELGRGGSTWGKMKIIASLWRRCDAQGTDTPMSSRAWRRPENTGPADRPVQRSAVCGPHNREAAG